MKPISLDTTVKEVLKNRTLLEVCNRASGGLFDEPAMAQAGTMSLQRIAVLLGPTGPDTMAAVVEQANRILAELPEDAPDDRGLSEVRASKGLEAGQTEQERLGHIQRYHDIRPGQVWYDTEGDRIQAHGACVFYEDGVYYWIGENKDHTTREGEIWTWGIKVYSSRDLCNWTDEGYLIEPELTDPGSIFFPLRRMDRPHLLHNERTGKYVLWLKYCDNAHFAVLTADSLKGKYTVVREVYKPFSTDCGDFDLAKDGATGQAYLYWEVDHTAVWGAKLSDDYTEAVGGPAVIYENMQPPFTREAVTHMERNGKHYLFTSGMTGYVPNPSEVAVSDDWLTGYRVLGDPHVDDASRSSFNSQISGILKVEGRELYIAIADRWVPDFVMTGEKYDIIVRAITARYDKTVQVTPEEKAFFNQIPVGGSANTSIADYVWLPIRWEGDTPRIFWHENWSPEEFQ